MLYILNDKFINASQDGRLKEVKTLLKKSIIFCLKITL